MSTPSAIRAILDEVALTAARASYAVTHDERARLADDVEALMVKLLEASRIEDGRFGEVVEAMQREPWVNSVLAALCEHQVSEPLGEHHHVLVLIRNAAQVILDAIDESPARLANAIIRDQFRIGLRLSRQFALRFLAVDPARLVGGIDATCAQRLALLASLAFVQQPSIASAEPFRALITELMAAGVPDADRIVEDGIEHPLAAE